MSAVFPVRLNKIQSCLKEQKYDFSKRINKCLLSRFLKTLNMTSFQLLIDVDLDLLKLVRKPQIYARTLLATRWLRNVCVNRVQKDHELRIFA